MWIERRFKWQSTKSEKSPFWTKKPNQRKKCNSQGSKIRNWEEAFTDSLEVEVLSWLLFLVKVLLHNCHPLVKSLEKFDVSKCIFFFSGIESLYCWQDQWVATRLTAGAESSHVWSPSLCGRQRVAGARLPSKVTTDGFQRGLCQKRCQGCEGQEGSVGP